MGMPLPDLLAEVEARLERMGFELVEGGWVGSPRRPIFRIRMDLPDSVPGKGGVNIDQCAAVSRELEPWLDAHPEVPERYVLEVSSPGVERPLTREADFHRFAGERVAVKGDGPLAGRARRLEGVLLGLEEGEAGSRRIRLKLDNGDEVTIPREEISRAHLVYSWD